MLIPVVGLLLVGCRPEPAGPSASNRQQEERAAVHVSKIIKIKVTAGGDITADGQPLTLEQLATKLSELKRDRGGVWYYRESPEGEPHPNAMKVVELVAENKLPVRLAVKPDFSDAVDDISLSHPGGE
jgi:hypothetical protein